MNPYKNIEWVNDLIKDLKQEKSNSLKKKQAITSKEKKDQDFEEGEQPTKKYKKNEEIKGDFQIKDFQWFEKSQNGKKFLKISKVPDYINQTAIKENQSNKYSSEKDSNIQQFLISQITSKDLCQSYFSQEQQEYLQFISLKIKEYIQKKGFEQIKHNYTIPINHKENYIQLLCENEENSLIISFKHNSLMAEQIIKLDEYHQYLGKIQALQTFYNKENKKNKINLMIIPLNNLKNLRFIEFDSSEISDIYKQRLYFKEYQQTMRKKTLKQIKQQPELLDTKVKIFDQDCQKSIIEYLKYQIDQKNEEKLDFYRNADNSVNFDGNDRSSQEFNSNDLYQQFFMIHALVLLEDSERNKIFQRYAEQKEILKRMEQQRQYQQQYQQQQRQQEQPHFYLFGLPFQISTKIERF